VLVVVLEGSAILRIDGKDRPLERGETLIIAKGDARKLTAGPNGVRYLSVHRRRPPLQIGSAPAAAHRIELRANRRSREPIGASTSRGLDWWANRADRFLEPALVEARRGLKAG
jgi:hypothetical protein